MTPPWYRAAWAIGRPLAPLAARGDGKLSRAVRGKLGAAAAIAAWAARSRDLSRPLIWLHAASVGEGRQAEAVLLRLRAARPEAQILYSHTSPSAVRLASTLAADFAGYAPLDTARDTGVALDAARPDLLCFAANDVWPELVGQASRRGVRLALVSANLAAASSRLGLAARSLLTPAYAALDLVGAIDQEDAGRLATLGVRGDRIVLTGDARHDAARARAAALDRNAPHLRALEGGSDPRPVVVAGSTWPADERRLGPALGSLRRSGVAFRLVMAPHEPTAEHLRALAAAAAALGPDTAVTTLSAVETASRAGPPATPRWDVCLVDRVGVLAELYAAAALAYVGGGFHRHGLHSVIEPAALGVPVLFGPQRHASRDARLLQEAGGGLCVSDADAIERALRAWIEDAAARAAAGAAARAVVDRGLGAAERSVALLLDLLNRPAA